MQQSGTIRKMDLGQFTLDFGVWWQTQPNWTKEFASDCFIVQIGCKMWLRQRQRDDPMINTISKTLEAQEKTHDIKQSPSMKIGTKPNARSWRNKLIEVTGCWTGHWTGHWWKVIGRSNQEARQQQALVAATGCWTRRCTKRWVAKWPDAGCQSPVNISKVLESSFRDRTRPVSADRTLVRVRSVAEKRDFVLNGYFLSMAYK